MRIMRLLWTLLLFATSCLAATTSVYVLSSRQTSDSATPSNVPTLSFAASSLVLSHLLGTAHTHPLRVQSAPSDFSAANEALRNPLVRGDVFEKIGGNLVVILSGVESGEEIFPSHEPAFFVSSTSTPLDFSALIREFSIRTEDSVFVDERARVRVVVGDKSLIDVIPAKPTAAKAFESLAIRYPETAYNSFDASILEDTAFVVEVQYVADLVSSLSKARQHVTYDALDFIGVRMSGLEGIRRKHGTKSQQYRNAVNILKDLYEKTVIPDFEQPYTTRAISTFILLPPTSISASSPISKRALPDDLATCYPDQATCQNSTNTCSGHGTCAQHPNMGNITVCFACQCAKINGTAYAGLQCQLQDVSTDFQLLFWTTVSLLVTTAGVCWFLIQSGNLENGGVALGTGGPLRQD